MDSWLSDWLNSANLQMSKEEIPYIRRPFEAIRRLSDERKISVIMPSPLTDQIFKWFQDRSPAGAHAIGSLFTSVFYYDAFFWKLEVPMAYGTVQLNALDWLSQMPAGVKEQLQGDRPMMWIFAALWVDSMDYGYGIDDLGRGARLPAQGNREFAARLTSSAHRELTACVRLLTESRLANAKALETARMATEMFLKGYLATHASLTEEEARSKFRHNLEQLVSSCKSARGSADLDDLANYMREFPAVGVRYDGSEFDNQQLWTGYAIALRTGVTFTRSLTDRDNRHQLQSTS